MRRLRIVALLLSLAVSHGRAAEIHLLPTGKAEGDTVRLKQVADISSSDPAEVAALGEIELGRAPAAGRSQTFTASQIRDVLARHGEATARCRLFGASRTVVRGPGAATSEVVSAAATEEPKAAVAKGTAKQAPIRQQPNRSNKLPPVDAGEPQAESAPTVLVRRGDAVSLVVRSGGVRISTSAIAQADGALDELIEVRSASDRRKTFLARVAGPQAVEIQAGAAHPQRRLAP